MLAMPRGSSTFLSTLGNEGYTARAGTRQPRPARCDAVSERDLLLPGSTIDTGQYTLSLVATTGPAAGASVRGQLWLEYTHTQSDAAPPSYPHVPLVGGTDADLGGVGAGATLAISPDSERPGVVVTHDVPSRSAAPTWRLYLATSLSDRRHCDWEGPCGHHDPTSGAGVVLDIRKIGEGAFAGRWHAVGQRAAGGFFCAAPVLYYSPFRTRSYARPPAVH